MDKLKFLTGSLLFINLALKIKFEIIQQFGLNIVILNQLLCKTLIIWLLNNSQITIFFIPKKNHHRIEILYKSLCKFLYDFQPRIVIVILFHIQLVEEFLSELVRRYHHSACGHHFEKSWSEAGVETGNSAGTQNVAHGLEGSSHLFFIPIVVAVGTVDELFAEFNLKS